jgi:toxin ParE1/3/4
MAGFRLSRLAEADLTQLLAASDRRWGASGRRRYAALLAAAIRQVAAEPEGLATRRRDELRPGIRSVHLRHARKADPEAKVRRPVHVLYYRVITSDLIEIVRVLHERMEPSRHLTPLHDER